MEVLMLDLHLRGEEKNNHTWKWTKVWWIAKFWLGET